MLALLALTGCFPEIEVPPPADCAERTTVFEDADGDGFGNAGVVALVCEPRSGFVDNALDCDDSDAHKGEDCDEGSNADSGQATDSGQTSDSGEEDSGQ